MTKRSGWILAVNKVILQRPASVVAIRVTLAARAVMAVNPCATGGFAGMMVVVEVAESAARGKAVTTLASVTIAQRSAKVVNVVMIVVVAAVVPARHPAEN